MVKVKHRYDGVQYEVVVDNIRVKHKDFCHLKNLYIVLHEWLIDMEWGSRDDPSWPETFLLHRETQKAGNEVRIWWRLQKIPHGNSYYKWDLDIDWRVILLKDTEVVHNGVKYKSNTSDIEITISGKIISDYQDTWKKHWLLKHLQFLFWKRIFVADFKMHRKEFYREAYRLQEALKTYFKLRTYLPEPEMQQFYYNEDFE